MTEHLVSLQSFALDTFEVTVGRFRNFVSALGAADAGVRLSSDTGADPSVPSSGWNTGDAGWVAPSGGDWGAIGKGTMCSGHADATWTLTGGSNENAAMNCVTWYDAFAFCARETGPGTRSQKSPQDFWRAALP